MPNRKESAKRRKDNANSDDFLGSGTYAEAPREIFERLNLLQSIEPTDVTPILTEDAAPPDFYFPVTGIQVLAKLHSLNLHTEGMTHVWLRGVRPTDCELGDSRLAECVCSNETRALILYPWASDGLLPLTKGRPSDRQLARFAQWSQELIWDGDSWGLKFAREDLRRFVIDYLLLEQVRHHLSSFSHGNSGDATPSGQLIERRYAIIWSACGVRIVE